MCSSAPEADLASTPDSCGLWREVVTSAPAPKATAERMMAPTLCGSVTWSSTTTSRVSPSASSGFGLSGFASIDDALVHGIAAGDLVDVPGLDQFGREGQGGEIGEAEPLGGVAGDQHARNLAAGIVERRADRVDAVEPHQPVGRGLARRDWWARAEGRRCARFGALLPARLLVAKGAAKVRVVSVLRGLRFLVVGHGGFYIRTAPECLWRACREIQRDARLSRLTALGAAAIRRFAERLPRRPLCLDASLHGSGGSTEECPSG